MKWEVGKWKQLEQRQIKYLKQLEGISPLNKSLKIL